MVWSVYHRNKRLSQKSTHIILNFYFRNYRFAAYRQFISWIYGRLGKHVRQVIPSCIVWAIRTKYPSEDNQYVPFHFSNED